MAEENAIDTGNETTALDNPEPKSNIFADLVPDARRTLRRVMLMSHDNKLATETAKDVLDRAGQTKKIEERQQRPIIISDSQVNLLLQVAKEIDEPEEVRNVTDG